jgi:hypothetical protein
MKTMRLALICLVGWYCILITAHYFGQRPLWNDEWCVLNSIIRLKPIALFTQPLLSLQEFPRFYLWCIQQFACPFNCHLLALRFFPFLAMLAAFFVWLKVARSQSRDLPSLILFIGCWCASIPLVYHAGELKPYSMDVLASGLFMLFLWRQPDLQNKPVLYCSLLFLLPLLGVMSYPVIFLYPLPLYNLIRDAYARRRLLPPACRRGRELLIYLGAGLLWVLIVYFFDYRVTLTGSIQRDWHDYFISFNSLGVFFKTFGQGINNIISRWFAEKPLWIRYASRFFVGSGLLYMLINSWRIFKAEAFRFRSLVPAAFAVFLLHVIFGCLHKYPFSVPRLSLFFAPFLLWMTCLSMQWLREKSKIIGTIIEVIFALYLVIISLGIARVVFACNQNLPHTGPGLGGQSVLWQKSSVALPS